MTKEEQRIAIAEVCGYQQIVRTADRRNELVGVNVTRMKIVHRGEYIDQFETIPDYLNDLNAMHEAEKVLLGRYNPVLLSPQDWVIYCLELDTVFEAPIHATASQRAEAFLRTLNLWKD